MADPQGTDPMHLPAGIDHPCVRDARGPVRLTNRHEISWVAYLGLEEDLQRILALPGTSLGTRLAVQSVYTDLVVALVRSDRGDAIGNRGTMRTPRDAGGAERFPPDSGTHGDADLLATTRRHYIDDPAMTGLLQLANRVRPSPALHRTCIGLVIAFRPCIYGKEKSPTRFGTLARITYHYGTALFRLGRIKLEALSEPFDYREFGRIGEDWLEAPDVAELLDRHFRHAIERKDLLLGQSVWLGQRCLAMHHALIRWHVAGLAAADKSPVAIAHVRQAVRDVEADYVSQTDLGALFDSNPQLGMVLDRLVRRPAFVRSLVASPVK